ncbi:hypothetical protein WDW37_15035 [Bdellovibrionota bacterium FG-1]
MATTQQIQTKPVPPVLDDDEDSVAMPAVLAPATTTPHHSGRLKLLDPIEKQLELPGPQETPSSLLVPLSPAETQQFQKFMGYPAGKRTVKLFTDTQVLQSVDRLQHHPNLEILLYTESACLVLFIALRIWLVSRRSTRLGKTWTKSWTLIVFLALFLLVIPVLVLWRDYFELLRQATAILSGS